MASKQQIYFLEFGMYLPLRADNVITLPSANENAAGLLSVEPDGRQLRVVAHGGHHLEPRRLADRLALGRPAPARARAVLHVHGQRRRQRARRRRPGATYGPTLLGTMTATSPPWFYGLAVCNLTGAAGFPNGVTVLGVSSNRSALRTFNDGQ